MATAQFHIHPTSTPTDEAEPVDFVVSLLLSCIVAATAFPLGVIVALIHVLGTIIRNILTCTMLAVGCVILTSAVLLVSAGYALVWIGIGALTVLVEFKNAIESGAKLGRNMASLFVDEFAKEKKKQLYERWGVRT